MKAIVVSEFGDASVLKYQESAQPEPGEGQVRIKMAAAGVNPVETYIRSGQYAALPALPYTPGNDGAGVVDKVGQGIQNLAAGQRVLVAAALARHNTGTYAEYTVCDAQAVWPLPAQVSFSQGAGIGTPGLAASYALFSKAKIIPGETVLIHGATGGVGTLALQLARKAGAVVYATAGTAESESTVLKLGAHKVFNHRSEGYLDEIKKSGNPDVIIEMLANVNLVKDLDLLARYGRIVVVGNRGSLDFSPRDVMAKDAAIHGMVIGNMKPEDFRANMFLLTAALESGLNVLVDQEFPLQEAALAHKNVMDGQKTGKIILSIA